MRPDDETTAALLTEAMRASVGSAVPPASLLVGLHARTTRRRRTRLTAAAAAVVALGVVAVWSGGSAADRAPTTTVPSASASPEASPTEEEVPAEKPVTIEATSLPPGYTFWHASPGPWRRVYTRGFTYDGRPRRTIVVNTFRDAYPDVDPTRFTDRGAAARWVRVGGRRVVRVTTAAGRVEYHWTEEPGVNVSVTGDPAVTDAQLRQVVAGARRAAPVERDPSVVRLEPHDDTGIVLPEVRGRGSRTLGPFVVPAEFDVHLACYGGDLRLRIGALEDIGHGCVDPDSAMVHIIDETDGVRSVTITLTADASTRWQLLVTTSAGPPI